jgi:pimeloyl-[acyl-carrier protein] methyl ester esterase
MQIAHRRALSLSRLVLIGATPCFVMRPDWPHGVGKEIFHEFGENLVQDYAGTLRRFLALQARGSGAMREVLRQLRERLLAMPRVSAEVLRGGLDILLHADLRAVLPDMPATLIHGTGDSLAPVEAARWLAANWPDSTLLEIPDAGHAPFLSHPLQVASCFEALSNGC